MSDQFKVCNSNGHEQLKLHRNFQNFAFGREKGNTVNSDSGDYALETVSKHIKVEDQKSSDGLASGQQEKLKPRHCEYGPKTKPSNRLSCIFDYKTDGNTAEGNGTLNRNKLKGRMGLGLTSSQSFGQAGQRMEGNCFLCDKEAAAQCPWCQSAYYCCDQHQKLHRPKTKCFPFKVAKLEGKGRGLVATRPIRARECILVESAVLSGPSMVTSAVCPSCLAPLKPPLLPCTKCSLPVCSPMCQENPAHKQECKLLADNRVKHTITNCEDVNSIYAFIMPYRLLKLRGAGGDNWSRVANLSDHIVKRAGLGEWDMNQKEVVNFIRRRCFMAKEFTDEDIHRAIGIIAVNSISLEPRRLFAGPVKGMGNIVGLKLGSLGLFC